MTTEEMPAWVQTAIEFGMDLGLKVLGALVLYIIGRLVIGWVKSAVATRVTAQLDATISRYVESAVGVLLNALLFLAILSVFGVETTTFAGLLAGAGIAIGMAWSGLLANFAAGAFMVVLRPFNVGDFVEVGGVTGTVVEMGLFVTIVNTPDNVRTLVGNNTIFAGTIRNYSANPYRRVDLVAQLNHEVDPNEAITVLRERLVTIANVQQDPAPDVYILEFNLAGPVLCVRPYVHTDHYWQVYFDTNQTIRDAFGEKGFPVPEQHYRVQGSAIAAK